MTIKKYKPYLISIAIPLAVGGLSAFFTIKGMPYYEMQQKPFFTPPEAAFPIVWTILYILMGISAARIWKSNDPKKGRALKIYGLQLAANYIWSVIFFGLLFLIGLIVKMIAAFAPIDRTAAKLQIPYLIWCIFAAAVNFGVWRLNH